MASGREIGVKKNGDNNRKRNKKKHKKINIKSQEAWLQLIWTENIDHMKNWLTLSPNSEKPNGHTPKLSVL